jgi:hypothetical protein
MVNYSTNINKANYHLSPQFIEHKKKTTRYCTEDTGPDFGTGTKM